MTFFGAMSLMCGSLFLLLPETLGHPLVESLEELEQMRKGDGAKPFFAWWSTEEVEKHLRKNQEKEQYFRIK